MYWALAIALILFIQKASKSTDKAALKKKTIAGGSLFGIGMLISRFGLARSVGVLNSAFILLPIIAPLLRNLGIDSIGSPSLKSRYILLNMDEGNFTGIVLSGEFKGKNLEDMKEEDIIKLFIHLNQIDFDSAKLLAAWIEKSRPEIIQKAGYYANSSQNKNTVESNMSIKEAQAILGVSDKSSEEEIKQAHRKLLLMIHPDKGGSHYLATKVNQAKDLLINIKRSA